MPVPVLDEDGELFGWDTANYSALSLPVRVGAERRPVFAYARTPPDEPTFTSSAVAGGLAFIVAEVGCRSVLHLSDQVVPLVVFP